MIKIKKDRSFEEKMLILQEEARKKKLSIADILRVLSGKGRPLILILLSLPFCQPIQIPGLSTPFGLVIAFIGLRMAFGQRVWLPQKVLSRNISTRMLRKVIDKMLVIIRKMKPWIHPRLIWLCRSRGMIKGNGVSLFILGIILALPLPIPLSNLIAGWSILLIALGIMESDGVFVLSGYILFFSAVAFLLMMTFTIRDIFQS